MNVTTNTLSGTSTRKFTTISKSKDDLNFSIRNFNQIKGIGTPVDSIPSKCMGSNLPAFKAAMDNIVASSTRALDEKSCNKLELKNKLSDIRSKVECIQGSEQKIQFCTTVCSQLDTLINRITTELDEELAARKAAHKEADDAQKALYLKQRKELLGNTSYIKMFKGNGHIQALTINN